MKIASAPTTLIPQTFAAPKKPEATVVQDTFTPEVETQWSEFRQNSQFCPASLVKIDEQGKWHLDGVRWGYDENGVDASKWTPRFKDITVDPKDIKEVYIGIEPFAPEWVAGHGQAVLEFNKPMTNADGEQDNRLVISLEAWTKPGDDYGLMKGMGKNFGVIYQLGTFSDRVQRQCRKEGRPIVLHRLNLTQEQKEAFVQTSLDEATKNRKGEFYNTVTNSCFGAQVSNLNQVLPDSHQINKWTKWINLPRMSATIPGTAGLVLERYHLRTPDNPIELQADARLHPDAKSVQPRSKFAQMTQHEWWGPGCRIAGAAAGMAAGAGLAGPVGAVMGSVIGSYSAGVVADHARIINSSVRVSPDAFYPEHVKAALENAH